MWKEIGAVKVTKTAKKSTESTGFIALNGCRCDKNRWIWIGTVEVNI